MRNAEDSGPPAAWPGQQVVGGPERCGSEQRWRLRLPDGRSALLGQLLPELARDPALRRRYVHDVTRLADLALPGVAKVLVLGPSPDPLDEQAPPPYRLREDPEGEDLETWLTRRAPLPLEEATALGAALCDLVHDVHRHGVVLRDLQPQKIRRTQEPGPKPNNDGRLLLLDIGLHRVDILSTRTAASLLLEGSPYAAPEQLGRTALDQRADLYSIGVILWRALTGTLPFGDAPLLLREPAPLPALSALRRDVSAESMAPVQALQALIERCLSPQPESRPDSAAQVARTLRGEEQGLVLTNARLYTTCQGCGARLRLFQRLCLSCGQQGVVFHHAAEGERDPQDLVLRKMSEDAELLGRLRSFLDSVAATPPAHLNFIVGHVRMYSKEEQASRLRLPLVLFRDLSPETATQLEARMKALGLDVKRVSPRRQLRRRRMVTAGVGTALLAVAATLGFSLGALAALPLFIVVAMFLGIMYWTRRKMKRLRRPLDLLLRPSPVALPASDPLVARLSALLRDGDGNHQALRPDVQEVVRELALLTQRVVDHRASLLLHKSAPAAAEMDYLIEPLVPIVAQIEGEVQALRTLDGELLQLDEGTLVRALQRSEARDEPRAQREPLLAALDRLRVLEDRRGAALHRLLEASSLLRNAAELGLSVQDAEAEHQRHVQQALAALGAT